MICPLLLCPLLIGWLLDLCFGDPSWLLHPVVGFGKWIGFWEHRLNHGRRRKLKGAFLAITSILLVFGIAAGISYSFFILHSSLFIVWNTLVVFYCLAGTTLIREVRAVFQALDRSLDEGRQQVARIVGRDTSQLTAQEVRTAALETLAENLSDGVVAPLFWFALLGAPGMLTYKMVNTLDSMIGYRTARYRDFGCWAARIDDIANFIPARLTALLMIISNYIATASPFHDGKGYGSASSAREWGRGWVFLFNFVLRNARNHASPNSGYPEAALAGILDCRFGGPHIYFGELIEKPYIGDHDRPLTTEDMKTAIRINRCVEIMMIVLTALIYCLLR